MRIGQYQLINNVILAPMAGVTDQPFRQLCHELGAGMTVSEMLSSNPKVWHTDKSRQRMDHSGELGIRAVQIAGSEPHLMAEAARVNVAMGAQIIDINMGCPAKKVNKKLAGSALMQHPALVEKILTAVVEAVDVPVTLKTRTGWDPEHKNGIEIAQIAERCGIQSLAIMVAHAVCTRKLNTTPSGDKTSGFHSGCCKRNITCPEQAKSVLDNTGADAIMIGRGAQGNPWLFREIDHYLRHGEHHPKPSNDEVAETVLKHVKRLHQFYGDYQGVRIARKHVGWYLNERPGGREMRQQFNQIEQPNEQLDTLEHYFVTVEKR